MKAARETRETVEKKKFFFDFCLTFRAFGVFRGQLSLRLSCF
jgi:hypothetical protein